MVNHDWLNDLPGTGKMLNLKPATLTTFVFAYKSTEFWTYILDGIRYKHTSMNRKSNLTLFKIPNIILTVRQRNTDILLTSILMHRNDCSN